MKILQLVMSIAVVLGSGVAFADPQGGGSSVRDEAKEGPTNGFVELAGAFGFQFGEQSYLPDGAPGDSKHPLTNGLAGNVTAGYQFLDGLDVIVDYTYANAASRSGNLDNALAGVKGTITFQTLGVGLRSSRALGPGRLYGELALGVVFPFETELEYEYAPAMSALPQPVAGVGTKVDKYGLGVGAHGELGYQVPLWNKVYFASALRIQGFQSNNDGESTELSNFVPDFTAPQAVTTTIDYGTSGMATPTTYSVQDFRLHFNLGYWL